MPICADYHLTTSLWSDHYQLDSLYDTYAVFCMKHVGTCPADLIDTSQPHAFIIWLDGVADR